MDDRWMYWIEIRGQTDERDLNSASPVRLTVERTGEDRTVCSVQTDQCGLIGAVRHLHSLGLMILSVICSTDSSTGSPKT
jgi:hypothetical protein